jgi:hypothetical protein
MGASTRGRSMRMKVITVSSVFPATPDEIWARLVQVETLQYVAAPYAAFSPVDPEEGTAWEEGAVLRFRLRVCGIIPMGMHTVKVKKFDKASLAVQTVEGNKTVPVWNHKIALVPIDSSSTRYTDEVEIYAGRLTGLVCLWSRSFYRHRQRKWLKLLSDRS